jgi:TPR repeat protein
MPSELKESTDFANTAGEIYLTLGRRDLANHLSCVRDAYLRLREKGYHFIYREFDELGDRTYHPTSNDDALAWATRLRNKNIAPSAEEARLLRAFASAPPAAVNGYYPTLSLVGGAPAGAVLQKLFESKDAAVRAAAAETCVHGIFGDQTTTALTKLVSDSSIKVRRSAIRALARYANWRYAPAQAALIALATDKSGDPLDRLAATDALAYAVRLQVKGVRQDPPMFRALVSLLQEKEEPIRATAAGTLAPLYEPSGEGAQRRRAPEGGWEKWLDEITAQHTVTIPPPGTDLAARFQSTLKSAEQGDVKSQSAVAMMYADGKGVAQNYPEACKWWVKAAEGGDLVAARHAWNLYRNGEGAERNPTIANQWAKVIGEPVQVPRNATAAPKK